LQIVGSWAEGILFVSPLLGGSDYHLGAYILAHATAAAAAAASANANANANTAVVAATAANANFKPTLLPWRPRRRMQPPSPLHAAARAAAHRRLRRRPGCRPAAAPPPL
jgi:hypothetical protein